MSGVPVEVMEQARKVEACLQEMNSVQIKHGLVVNLDYDFRPEVQFATEDDVKFLKEPVAGFSFFVGMRGGKKWCCHKNYETGRRVIADASFTAFGDGEPYSNHHEVQWEWLD